MIHLHSRCSLAFDDRSWRVRQTVDETHGCFDRQTSGFRFENHTRASGGNPLSRERRPHRSAFWVQQELQLPSIFSILKSCENTGATLLYVILLHWQVWSQTSWPTCTHEAFVLPRIFFKSSWIGRMQFGNYTMLSRGSSYEGVYKPAKERQFKVQSFHLSHNFSSQGC